MNKLAAAFVLFFASTTVLAKEIPLKWKTIKGAAGYNFEVGKDRDFSEVMFRKSTKDSGFNYKTPSGIYFLRVQAVNDHGKGGHWSKPFKLVVTAPIEANAGPDEKLTIADNDKPAVQAAWRPTESEAPKYLVRLLKDGQEIDRQTTTTPTAKFSPTEKGDYTVIAQAGLDKYFGPEVLVKKFSVTKIEFQSPRHPVVAAMKPRFSENKPVEINFPPLAKAKKYKLTLYQLASRGPAAEKIPVMTKEVDSPTADFGKLPPGRYTASVESEGVKTSAPLTEYSFNVRKAKPLEFERIDLSFKYNFHQISYSNNIQEAGSSNYTNTVGGDLGFQGTMWFPDSNWGLRAEGHFGNVLIEQSLVGINELIFAGTYKHSFDWLRFDSTFYFGGRLFTLPFMNKNNNQNGSFSTDVYEPSFFGPVIGANFLRPLGPKWSLLADIEFSQPLNSTSFSGIPLTQPLLFNPNVKLQLGARYALNQTTGLVGSLGVQDDGASYYPSPSNAPNNFTNTTNIHMSGLLASLGVEMSDETSNFAEMPGHEWFSDIRFSLGYAVADMRYHSQLMEVINSSTPSQGIVSFNSLSGFVDMQALGFFSESHNGFFAQAKWNAYGLLGQTISYPEFGGRWAYKTNMDKHPTWQFTNLLGVRSWVVPDVRYGGTVGPFTSINIQLLGPEEGFNFSYALSENWSAEIFANVATPVLGANKPSTVDKIFAANLSYDAGIQFSRRLTPDISLTAKYAYVSDQLRYTANSLPDNQSSSAQMDASTFGLTASYTF